MILSVSLHTPHVRPHLHVFNVVMPRVVPKDVPNLYFGYLLRLFATHPAPIHLLTDADSDVIVQLYGDDGDGVEVMEITADFKRAADAFNNAVLCPLHTLIDYTDGAIKLKSLSIDKTLNMNIVVEVNDRNTQPITFSAAEMFTFLPVELVMRIVMATGKTDINVDLKAIRSIHSIESIMHR